MYTNSQILAAVVSTWVKPLAGNFLAPKLDNPIIAIVENWVKSTGVVSPNYSAAKDIMNVIGGASDIIILPYLNQFISKIDDSLIPAMAHRIVDNALDNGELSFAEGYLTIEEADLKRLKRLLELNLPIPKEDFYIVKTE